jgi:hypothetical protein
VTLDPCPIGREASCEVCKAPIEQPKGKGRRRTTCSSACRKALSRAIKRMPRIEPLGIFDLYNCPGSVLDVWHDKHKRGLLWPEGDVLKVRFRYHTFRLTGNLASAVRVVAFNEYDPGRWKRFPDRKSAPRKKKTVQLHDTDWNRDMESDSAKWDSDGGFSKDAEIAVANIFGVRNRDSEGEYKASGRNPAKFYADLVSRCLSSEYERAYLVGPGWASSIFCAGPLNPNLRRRPYRRGPGYPASTTTAPGLCISYTPRPTRSFLWRQPSCFLISLSLSFDHCQFARSKLRSETPYCAVIPRQAAR